MPELALQERTEERDLDSGAAELAGFGRPPSGYLGVPGYVLRVRSRQKELKAKVKEINELLAKAEAERDGAEAQLGQAAIDFGLLPDMAEEIERKVGEAERSISAARGRSSQEQEHHTKETARLDAELAKVREAAAPLVDLEAALKEGITDTEANLNHLNLTVQRLQIELRNLEQGKTTGPTAEPRARLVELHAELAKAQATVQKEGTELAKLQKEAAELSKELSPLRKKQASLEEERRKELASHEEKAGEASEGAKRAFAWRRSMLAQAGRKVLTFEERPRLTDGDRLYGRIQSSHEKVAKIQSDLELNLRALDSFDREAFSRARQLLYFAMAVVGLLIVAGLIYTCSASADSVFSGGQQERGVLRQQADSGPPGDSGQ